MSGVLEDMLVVWSGGECVGTGKVCRRRVKPMQEATGEN